MNRIYSSAELDEILARHRDGDRGMRLVGLSMAAASGFIAACVIFGAARIMGWW